MRVIHLSEQVKQTIHEFLIQRQWTKLKRICDGVKRLHDFYTQKRYVPSKYMNREFFRYAYIYYYLPVNFIKLLVVFDEMHFFDNDFFNKDFLDVLDFGCGAGTCSMAILQEIAERGSAKLNIYLYDKAEKSVQDAIILLDMLSQKLSFTNYNTSTWYPDTHKKFDLILLANVLQELADAEKVIFKLLQNNLKEDGYLIIIEPALRECALQLMGLKKQIVQAGFKVASPCLNLTECPMLSDSKLWCHHAIKWERPDFIQKVDARTGIYKQRIKFSYLIMTLQGKTLGELYPDAKRVVGDFHKQKFKGYCFVCANGRDKIETFELLKRHKRYHPVFYKISRLDIIYVQDYMDLKETEHRILPSSKFYKIYPL